MHSNSQVSKLAQIITETVCKQTSVPNASSRWDSGNPSKGDRQKEVSCKLRCLLNRQHVVARLWHAVLNKWENWLFSLFGCIWYTQPDIWETVSLALLNRQHRDMLEEANWAVFRLRGHASVHSVLVSSRGHTRLSWYFHGMYLQQRASISV